MANQEADFQQKGCVLADFFVVPKNQFLVFRNFLIYFLKGEALGFAEHPEQSGRRLQPSDHPL